VCRASEDPCVTYPYQSIRTCPPGAVSGRLASHAPTPGTQGCPPPRHCTVPALADVAPGAPVRARRIARAGAAAGDPPVPRRAARLGPAAAVRQRVAGRARLRRDRARAALRRGRGAGRHRRARAAAAARAQARAPPRAPCLARRRQPRLARRPAPPPLPRTQVRVACSVPCRVACRWCKHNAKAQEQLVLCCWRCNSSVTPRYVQGTRQGFSMLVRAAPPLSGSQSRCITFEVSRMPAPWPSRDRGCLLATGRSRPTSQRSASRPSPRPRRRRTPSGMQRAPGSPTRALQSPRTTPQVPQQRSSLPPPPPACLAPRSLLQGPTLGSMRGHRVRRRARARARRRRRAGPRRARGRTRARSWRTRCSSCARRSCSCPTRCGPPGVGLGLGSGRFTRLAMGLELESCFDI